MNEKIGNLICPPIYDILSPWEENLKKGPVFNGSIPTYDRNPKELWCNLLGFKLSSPIGIAAGPLLDSKWILFASDLGFDILTYKTIRSSAHPAHPLPNVLYIDRSEQLDPRMPTSTLHPLEHPPLDRSQIAITNSFGNPSMDRSFLENDIATARNGIKEGQLFIVSVFGTGNTLQEVASDFARTAKMAKESGAMVIEANLSCPNVNKGQGSLYTDPSAIEAICSEIKKSIGATLLLIKVGSYSSTQSMKECFVQAARTGVNGICGINTISAKVMGHDGKPSLGETRPTSGICGNPIRSASQQFVKEAHEIITEQKLDLALIGVGGINAPEHFDHLIELGADAALCATAMMWDPLMAIKRLETQKNRIRG